MKHLAKSFILKLKQGLASNLEDAKPTLVQGEPLWTTDTKKLYISDADGGTDGHELVEIVKTDQTDPQALINGHLQIDMGLDFVEASVPDTPASDTLRLFATEFHGISRLQYRLEDGDVIDLSRDSLFIAQNTSGGTINRGEAVYITGSTGNVPTVSKAKADSISTMPAAGLAHDTVDNNGFLHVVTAGLLSNFDTSAFSEGDQLYVSETTAGALTITRPTYPNLAQIIGHVTVDGVGNGAILIVHHDVEGDGYYNGAFLRLDGSNADSNIDIGSYDLATTGELRGGSLTDGTFSVTAGVITGASGSNSQWTNDEGFLTAITGESIGDLVDVDLTGIANDKILKWDTDKFVVADESGGGGTPAGSTGYIQFNDDGSFGGDADLFWDNTNKRVGIGTDSPEEALHVNGVIISKHHENSARDVFYKAEASDDSNAAFYIANITNTNGIFRPGVIGYRKGSSDAFEALNFYSKIDAAADTGTNPLMRFAGLRVTGDPINGSHTDVVTRPILEVLNRTTSLILVDVAGKVGIGTKTPSERLEVSGIIKGVNTGAPASVVLERTDGAKAALQAGGSGATFQFEDTGYFMVASNARADIPALSTSDSMRIAAHADGRTMLGDWLVSDVSGGTTSGTLAIKSHSSSQDILNIYDSSGSEISMMDKDGNLAIGSTSANGSRLFTKGETSAVGKYAFYAQDSSGSALLAVENSGNIGIGTAYPMYKLEVNGQICIKGGAPGAGKILTSNLSGVATWKTPTQEQLLQFFIASGSPIGGDSPSYAYASTGVVMAASRGFAMPKAGSIDKISLCYSVSNYGTGVDSLSIDVLINGSVKASKTIDKTAGTDKTKLLTGLAVDYSAEDIVSIRLSATGGSLGVNFTTVSNLIGLVSIIV